MNADPIWLAKVARISDELWERMAPLLQIDKSRKKSGRPRRDDRVLLEGLLWLCLRREPWAALPAEFGPKSTCHARFREWIESGALVRAWPDLVRIWPDLGGIEWAALIGHKARSTQPAKRGPTALRRVPGLAVVDHPGGFASRNS